MTPKQRIEIVNHALMISLLRQEKAALKKLIELEDLIIYQTDSNTFHADYIDATVSKYYKQLDELKTIKGRLKNLTENMK